MKTLKKNHPLYSVLYNTEITPFGDSAINGSVVDFKKHKNGILRCNTGEIFDALMRSETIIINCCFPSSFVIDIIYFIVVLSQRKELWLSIDNITNHGLLFLKKIGLKGLTCNHPTLNCQWGVDTKITKDQSVEKARFLFNLSAIEVEVFYFISKGMNNGQIAEWLDKSYHTIKNHKINIVRKTGLEHSYELPELITVLNQSPL
jgi:hypothetical protein